MRKSIIAKILIGYVIYAVIGILFITILSSILTQNSITRIYGRNLYNNAVRLADNCKKASTSSDLSTASEYLDTIPEYLDANIWLVKKDGTIIYDSTDALTNHIIADFNPAVYKGQYTVNAFENEIKKSNIVSIEPININYKIAGYLVLIQPMNSIIALNNAITNQFLFVFLLIFIISLLILLLLHFIIIKPLRKITEGANEFASGNLKYNIDIKSHDEMGYLAATLNYMSDELNNADLLLPKQSDLQSLHKAHSRCNP